MARILAAIPLITSLSSPAFAEDGVAATAAEPRIRVQAGLELLPLGSGESPFAATSMTMARAYAISGSLEVALTRDVSIGVAPRLVYNVISVEDTGARPDKELDLRACIRARTAVSSRLDIYASFLPGYATLLSGGPFVYTSSNGYALGAAFGFTYDLGEPFDGGELFVSGELGVQRSFLRITQRNAEDVLSYDLELAYLHLGAGIGMRF